MAYAVSDLMNSALQSPVQLGAVLFGFIVLTFKAARFLSDRRRNPARLPLPPGPKGYPIIGNVFDMPTSQTWLKYAQWAKVYGDVFSVEVFGQRIIFLNSLEATQELLEKRSACYSDRPRMPMMLELMDFNFNFGLIPYGPWWRRHRRAFMEHFRSSSVWKYHSVQERETKVFLNRLLQSPDKFVSHIRQALATGIMNIAYGIQITGFDDPYIVNVEESLDGFTTAGITGTYLVDMMPILKYVPSWVPGAGFKKIAAHCKALNKKVVELPFNHVLRKMKEGTAGPSVAATLISALPEGGDKKELAEETKLAQNVAAVAFFGGADTTFSAIQTFFLAMAMFPEAQKKAQAELDAVVGSHRLPEFGDRPSLPYVNAVIKETLRWQQVAPLAVGHMAVNDDVYNGYFIPKGSILLGNAWAILHDERAFTNPLDFNPDRYLKDGQLDPDVRQPDTCAFGYGRRICPGRFLADNTLFSILSSTLYSFNITPALNEKGEPMRPAGDMSSGMISYPEPFKIDIKTRSPSAETLVKDAILGVN